MTLCVCLCARVCELRGRSVASRFYFENLTEVEVCVFFQKLLGIELIASRLPLLLLLQDKLEMLKIDLQSQSCTF